MAKADLDAKAHAMVGPTPTAVAAAPAAEAAASAKAAAPAPAASAERRLADWAAAWSAKDADAYLAFYSADFGPARAGRAKWQAERRRLLSKPGEISVKVSAVTSKVISPTRVETSFEQAYRSSNYSDTAHKTLTWALQGGQWLIVAESNR
jgi:adhesin transport system outer membrane protein